MRGAQCVLALALVGCADGGSPSPDGVPWGGLGTTEGDPGGGASTTAEPPAEPMTSSGGASSEGGATTEPPPDPPDPTGDGSDDGGTTTGVTVPFDLDDVIWLHEDVSDWPEDVVLSDVTFDGGTICLLHDIADQDPPWPTDTVNVEVQANPWVFIEQDGQWYAGTWEWLRPEQQCKNMSSVAGDHIKVAPFDEASGWTAQSGETYYFMVSGFARLGLSNVESRSNIVEVVWP